MRMPNQASLHRNTIWIRKHDGCHYLMEPVLFVRIYMKKTFLPLRRKKRALSSG